MEAFAVLIYNGATTHCMEAYSLHVKGDFNVLA